MIYLGRTVTDYIKVFQEEVLATICPLAGNSCLNKHKERFLNGCSAQLTIVYHHCTSFRA